MALTIKATINKGGSNKKEKPAYYMLSNPNRLEDQLISHPFKGTNNSTWQSSLINSLVPKHKISFVDGKLSKLFVSDPKEEN